MFYKLDIAFENEEAATAALGNIKMYFVGTNATGHIKEDGKKYREYILSSTDISKLNNITNAISGSKAFVVDIDKTYVLNNGIWTEQS